MTIISNLYLKLLPTALSVSEATSPFEHSPKDSLSQRLRQLLLVIPATNATSESEPSAPWENSEDIPYLRSTMAQKRLNYIMLLHIHKEKTDDLKSKLLEVSNLLVHGSEHKKNTLRKFTYQDWHHVQMDTNCSGLKLWFFHKMSVN